MITLMIPGKPLGKQRPRMTRGGHVYTPQQTVNYEVQIKEAFRAEYPDFVPMDGPVLMTVTALFPIPKSASKKKRFEMLAGRVWPTKKPDFDNIIKVVSDSLNGMAYDDDKQIVQLMGTKRYAEVPGIIINIGPINCGTEGQEHD